MINCEIENYKREVKSLKEKLLYCEDVLLKIYNAEGLMCFLDSNEEFNEMDYYALLSQDALERIKGDINDRVK